MTINLKDQLKFATDTETVTLRVVDSADPVTVEYAVAGNLSRNQIQWLATAGIEPKGLSILLDEANLDGAEPINGGRIDRTDGSKWRIRDSNYNRATGVYVCTCTQVL